MTNNFTKRRGRDITVKENAEQSALICDQEQIKVIPFVKSKFLDRSFVHKSEWYDPNYVYDTCIRNNSKISITFTGIDSGLTAVTTAQTDEDPSGLKYLLQKNIVRPCSVHVMSYRSRAENGETSPDSQIIFFRSGPERYHEHILDSIPGVKINTSGKPFPITAGILDDPLCEDLIWEYDYEFGLPGLPGHIQLVPKEFITDYGKEPEMYICSGQSEFTGKGVQQRLLDPVTEGNRNNQLASRAGIVFGVKKETFEKGLKYLHEINRQCFLPPLTDREVENTAKSIFKRASGNG